MHIFWEIVIFISKSTFIFNTGIMLSLYVIHVHWYKALLHYLRLNISIVVVCMFTSQMDINADHSIKILIFSSCCKLSFTCQEHNILHTCVTHVCCVLRLSFIVLVYLICPAQPQTTLSEDQRKNLQIIDKSIYRWFVHFPFNLYTW